MKHGSGYRAQSTKVSAVVGLQPQSTLDVRKWPSKVFDPLGFPCNVKCIKDIMGDLKFRAYYGINSGVLLNTTSQIYTAINAYLGNSDYPGTGVLKLDMLALLNRKTPPMWIENNDVDYLFYSMNCPTDCTYSADKQAQMVHHPLHVIALKNKLETIPAMNRPKYFAHTDDPLNNYWWGTNFTGQGILEFLKEHFNI